MAKIKIAPARPLLEGSIRIAEAELARRVRKLAADCDKANSIASALASLRRQLKALDRKRVRR